MPSPIYRQQRLGPSPGAHRDQSVCIPIKCACTCSLGDGACSTASPPVRTSSPRPARAGANGPSCTASRRSLQPGSATTPGCHTRDTSAAAAYFSLRRSAMASGSARRGIVREELVISCSQAASAGRRCSAGKPTARYGSARRVKQPVSGPMSTAPPAFSPPVLRPM